MINFENEKELVDYAYKEYIKYWIDNHNIDESAFMTYIIEDWLKNNNCFDRNMYVCKNEFFDNEYQDKEIMKEILSPEIYEFYLNIRSTKK